MTPLSIDARTQLYVRAWGEGRPVVFIHGWALNADAWNGPMVHLSERGFRCIAYDQRGHGRSSDPGQGFDYDSLADDLAGLMDELDLRDATLVAHSMGGGTAVRYLSRHGAARVSQLVLVAPSTGLLRRSQQCPEGFDLSFLEATRDAWRRDFPGWIVENAGPFFGHHVSEAMIQWGIRMALQCSLKAAVECNRSMEHGDFRAELSALDLPTLLLHGDADESLPLEVAGLPTAARVKGCRLEIYEGGPHGLMFSHLDRLNADLEAFLAEV